MTHHKEHFGITEHLVSKDLLDSSQKLILTSNQLITRLQSQIHHCKSLVESLKIDEKLRL